MAFTTVYVWQDLDAPEAEQKFGDHFCEVDTLEQAFTDTQKYIRGSLGRQKHKFDEGRIVIHKVWDATEYAKLKGRFGKHQKIDDVIRPVIGHHVQADVHRIDADTLIERVNKELIRHNQPLPVAGLSQNQYDAANNVLEAISAGKRTIIAELCARFGKTIWSRRVGDTEYGFKLLPFGGYIRMIGMLPPKNAGAKSALIMPAAVEAAREHSLSEIGEGEENRAFYSIKSWQKLIVMMGGPFMNLVLGTIILVSVTSGIGQYQPNTTVSFVATCSPTAQDVDCAKKRMKYVEKCGH